MNQFDAVEILIVEDNPLDAELTVRVMKEQNLANKIFVVEDGEAALDFLFCKGKFADRDQNTTPKVVFLDLKLPKMNGLEVLKEIKADTRTKSLPVVIVTSSREDPDIQTAYDLGANSYIIKPIKFDAFSQALSNAGLYWLVINQPPK